MSQRNSNINNHNINASATSTSKVLKILIAGGAETGKTAILRNYNGLEFQPAYIPTVNSDFSVKNVCVPAANSQNADNVCIQLWDIGATSSMGKSFFRNTHGVIFVVDCPGAVTFQNIQAHIEQSLLILNELYDRVCSLASFADNSFPCLLMVNKFDLLHDDADKRQLLDACVDNWLKSRRSGTGQYTNVSSGLLTYICRQPYHDHPGICEVWGQR
jgi:GTPase SAR1 family protein